MANLLFNDFDEHKIVEYLHKNNMLVSNNYLLVTKQRSIKEGLLKLFINNTYNAMDASLQFLLIFTSDAIYEAQISGDLLDFMNRGELSFNVYQHTDIRHFKMTEKMTKYVLSWDVLGKSYAYEVDKFQGIYGFVKENFKALQKNNFYF